MSQYICQHFIADIRSSLRFLKRLGVCPPLS